MIEVKEVKVDDLVITFQEICLGNDTHRQFALKDEPEILHIIESSGFKNKFYCFWENAYETEPKTIESLTTEQIKEKFKIIL